MFVFYKIQFKKSFPNVKYYSTDITWIWFETAKFALKCRELGIMGITDVNLIVEFVLHCFNFKKSLEYFSLFNINDLASITSMNNLQFDWI